MSFQHYYIYDAFQNTAATIFICILCMCIVKHTYFQHLNRKVIFTASLIFSVQQLQGIKYPLLFKRMNEKMNEWRRAVEGTEQPLRVGPRPQQCVSVPSAWTRGTRSGRREHFHHEATEQTDSQLELLDHCFIQGSRQTAKVLGEEGGEGGLQPFFTHSAARQLRGSTCKNKAKKKSKNKRVKTAQNGLNLIYSVVYTCNWRERKKLLAQTAAAYGVFHSK